MKMTKTPTSYVRPLVSSLFAAALLILCAMTPRAQAIDCAQFNPGSDRVTLQFTKTFTKASAKSARVTIFRLPKVGEAATAVTVATSAPTLGEDELTNTIAIVVPKDDIAAGELYLVFVDGLLFGDTPQRLTGQFKSDTKCGKPDAAQAPTGRDDANVYISGTLTTASGSDLQGTLDTKLRRSVFQTNTLQDSLPNVISDVGLVFDLKASGDPKADPDSMNFGVEWEMDLRKANDKGPLNYLFHYLYPKIESERDFGNTNLLLDQTLKFGLKRPAPKPWAPVISPFIGQELGKNLQSPVDAAEGSGIYRLKAGTLFNLFFEPALSGLNRIEIDAEYTRRWPLRRELRFQEDKDKNLTLLEITKRPRDYVRANINFMFREDFGGTIGYEYGELPPSFKLVDHKLKIGLVYKIK